MANKFKVGDVVRWTKTPGWNNKLTHMEALREPFTVVQVASCFVNPFKPHNHKGFVVIRDSRGELGWFVDGTERLDPRWLELDPFLTAVHRRRQHAETNPDPSAQ